MSGARAGAALRRRFVEHVQRERLLHDGERVIVALSGGLDSTMLLYLLRFGEPSVDLSAAHFDHAMRVDSGEDAAWVRGLCVAWSVPLAHARAADPARNEAGAREQRYAFLHDTAAGAGADTIVTAHHADDQAETVLFRLARGTGLAGLAGIAPRRGMIVRPLLPFTRAELLAGALECGLRWREDPSNVRLHHARNRIRHQVLPALEAAHAGAARNIAAFAARAAEAERAWSDVIADAAHDVVESRSDGAFTLARDRLLAYHPHVRARVLRHLLAQLGSRPDRAGTRVALQFVRSGDSGRRVMLETGVVLDREFDSLRISRPTGPPAVSAPVEIVAAVPGTGEFTADGHTYDVHWGSPAGRGRPAHSACFDPSSLQFPLVLRTWRPGDRIRLEYGTKKLKKLFQERRLGRARRRRAAVLVDAAGQVLWVAGVARSTVARPAGDAGFTVMVMDGDTY